MKAIFINSLTSGGAEKVVLTLLEGFRRRGQAAELVCIEKERFYPLPEQTALHYLTRFESLENGPLKIPYLVVCAFRLKRHVRKNKISVVQSHLFRASFINVLARLFGSDHYTQIIIHSRINFDHQPWLFRTVSRWCYGFLFRKADSIISISQVMKSELDDYLGLKHHPNHQVIYNPHPLAAIRELGQHACTDFFFEPEKKYLIAIGRMVTLKRFGDIIQALELLRKDWPQLELIFIGSGPEQTRLEAYAKSLNLEDAVHFLGYRDNPYSYLAKADLLVLSSQTEGLPNSIIEALSCGTPVVAADCISGPREILHPESDLRYQCRSGVEKGSYGLLYPVGEVKDLAGAVHLLLSDEPLYAEYQASGYERSQSFDDQWISEVYLKSLPPSVSSNLP